MMSALCMAVVITSFPVLAVTDWKTANLRATELPSNIEQLSKAVTVEQGRTDVGSVDTFYQTADPPAGVEQSGQVVLLLHGAAFSSDTWVGRVPTVPTLAALGHRVIAIDLPGFPRKTRGSVRDKGKYLADVIDTLSPDTKPVVVTPSASGAFIFPFLNKYHHKISGWVPVAPVSINTSQQFYQDLSVPTMIVYGERDTGARRSTKLLSQMPNSTPPQELPNAGHPAYLDQPQLWHKLLANFLNLLASD